MNSFLQRVLNNKHTTIAALVYGLLVVIDKLAAIWLPDLADKIYETTSSLRQYATTYGLLTAGEVTPAVPQAPVEPPKP